MVSGKVRPVDVRVLACVDVSVCTINFCFHSNGAVLACVSVKSDDVTLSLKPTLS